MAARTRQAALQTIKNTIARGEYNDRRPVEIGAGSQQTSHVVAIEFRQANIEEDQIWQIILPALQSLKSFNTIRVAGAINASAPACGFHNFAYYQRIVDDDYLVHSSASPLDACLTARGQFVLLIHSLFLHP